MNLHLLVPYLFWPETSAASPPEIYRDLPLPALATLLAKSVRTTEGNSQGMEAWLCRAFNVARGHVAGEAGTEQPLSGYVPNGHPTNAVLFPRVGREARQAPPSGNGDGENNASGGEKQQDWPVAPITLAADGAENTKAGNDYWLRADPVHLRIERGQIVLADSRIFRISPAEAQELTDLLNRHFAENIGDNLTLLPLQPDRWYLRLAQSPALQTHSLSEVAGKNINNFLPTGVDSMAWHGVFNEIQMLLHEHPLNQAREARGELAINSVWFWGGGMMPTVEHNVYTKVWSNDVFVRALALASNIGFAELPPAANVWLQSAAIDSPAGNHLVVLDSLSGKAQYGDVYGWRESLKELEQNWFAPLLAGLKQGRINQLTITAMGEHDTRNFTVSRGDLWKFWRTKKLLSAYATINYVE